MGVVAIVVSALISLLLTEYYKSTVVIFPARTSSLILNESGIKRGNISDFGEEEEAEQLLQIINSEDLQGRVIDRHNLYEHYDIGRNERYSRTLIRRQYNSNVTARRTKYNSIEISVVDEIPEMAADIANSIAEFTDSVKNRMIQDRALTSLPMIQQENLRLQAELDSVDRELDTLQSQGVVGQIERAALFEGYGQASGQAAREIREHLKINQELGDEYDALYKHREIIIEQRLRFRNYHNQFLADAEISIPQKFVVDKAIPADKKSYPVRWLIVLGSLLSVLIFAIVALILKENAEQIFQQG